jgi:hypothetical protein
MVVKAISGENVVVLRTNTGVLLFIRVYPYPYEVVDERAREEGGRKKNKNKKIYLFI